VDAGFASGAGWAGVAIADRNNPTDHHELIAIRAADGAEIANWRFSESWAYRGALSPSGAIFCGLLTDGKDWRLRTIACRDNLTGQEIGKLQFELGKRGSNHALSHAEVAAVKYLPERYKGAYQREAKRCR
jgi:hypothetical protein